jgi:hypothetical protein
MEHSCPPAAARSICFEPEAETQTAPSSICYQGFITNNSSKALAKGSYTSIFSLYTLQADGSPIRQETHPAEAVKNGLFSVMLGIGSPAVPLLLPFDQQYYLGIKVGADPEFPKRVRLSSFACSFHAGTADDPNLYPGKNAEWEIKHSSGSHNSECVH